MKFIDAIKLALLRRLKSDAPTGILATRPWFLGQNYNPAKRAWRDLKARIGARQARRQTRTSYQLKKGASHA